MKWVTTLCGFTMDGLKMKTLNEEIINSALAGIGIISGIIIISWVIHVIFFKKWFDIHSKYKKLTDKIQSLESPTNETKKNIQIDRGG